jgi:alanine racemase
MNKRRTWIEINPLAFDHNVSFYKKIIGHNTLAVVIKANAYGHGMHHIAQLADTNPAIGMLCVTTVSDALSLRTAGIQKPILVLSTIFDEDLRLIIGKNIICSVYDIETISHLNTLGAMHGVRFPIHLKIDTGLARFGIAWHDALSTIMQIVKLPHVLLEGLYSHFAESHKKDHSYSLEQQQRFMQVVATVQSAGITIPFIHLANSAATGAFDLPFCNLFRVGVGIYGFWPSQENKELTHVRYGNIELQPIATWKTTIIHIKKVKKGEFIGYDRTFYAEREMQVAILPIGYYDGYDFRLFNKASVLIRNHYVPIVGRISMNVCTIDVTDIADVKVGDEIVVMGPYPKIHPAELGLLVGNSNVREITTKINPHIPRFITPPQLPNELSIDSFKNEYTECIIIE